MDQGLIILASYLYGSSFTFWIVCAGLLAINDKDKDISCFGWRFTNKKLKTKVKKEDLPADSGTTQEHNQRTENQIYITSSSIRLA